MVTRATAAATGRPLYAQRVFVHEHEKINGLVDVPQEYRCFRLGPVLLGCYRPVGVSAGDWGLGAACVWCCWGRRGRGAWQGRAGHMHLGARSGFASHARARPC